MKIISLEEPQLHFGLDKHIDVRFGISNYLPYDWNQSRRKSTIVAGVVGPSDLLGKLVVWLRASTEGVKTSGSANVNLYPDFPGFNLSSPFRTSLDLDEAHMRRLNERELASILSIKDPNALVTQLVDFYLEEIDFLREKNVDVILCCKPHNLAEIIADLENSDQPRLDFHDLLKARSMETGVPIQLIRPGTYGEKSKRKILSEGAREVQEPATVVAQ
jgi:hypothetical protein